MDMPWADEKGNPGRRQRQVAVDEPALQSPYAATKNDGVFHQPEDHPVDGFAVGAAHDAARG
jgi:hypothetical protein